MEKIVAVRAKVAGRFSKTLDSDELGRKLEVVLWNHTLRTCQRDKIPMEWTAELNLNTFRERYTQKALALDLHNLQKNDVLRANIQDGSLGLKKFASMMPWEMNPDFWAPIFERVAFKALRKQLTIDVANAPDGAFTCGKCKSKKTTFYQMQTRSADEPMTCFIQCLACGKRWKQ
jgi:DNA-directed RNA polymerase subunit M/transcription elongation factor TFIIS